MSDQFTEESAEKTSNATHVVPFPVVHNGIKVERSVTIQRPPEDIYAFWRKFNNLKLFMKRLERIDIIDERRSHWVWVALEEFFGGTRLEWDAEIIADIPGKMISWQSLDGADIANAGSVWFHATAASGSLPRTEVRLQVAYHPPTGKFGEMIGDFLNENVGKRMSEDLHRLQALMEAGEIPTIQGQVTGQGRAKDSAAVDSRPELPGLH